MRVSPFHEREEALGAVFADMFPNRVRAMVLDGAVDPDAGLSNTPKGGTGAGVRTVLATLEELAGR